MFPIPSAPLGICAATPLQQRLCNNAAAPAQVTHDGAPRPGRPCTRPAPRKELSKVKKGLAKAKTKGAAALLEALNE